MKNLKLFLLLIGVAFQLFSLGPEYYGARSLSLGYSSTGLNYDVNAIFINPALLSNLQQSASGYQYQQSYMDYKNFAEELDSLLVYKLQDFDALAVDDKTKVVNGLESLFMGESGFFGSRANVPGFVTRDYGISFSTFKTAFINPISTDVFNKPAGDITSGDIASLKMNFLGLDYKQISGSYSLGLGGGFVVGITLNYIYGKVADFDISILDSQVFHRGNSTKKYLESAWDPAEEKFSKITTDIGLSMNLGKYFTAGVLIKNMGSAKITTSKREIEINKRITAGLAFIPNLDWKIFLDIDLHETDLMYSGNKMQPISIGIEKSFFKQKLFLRAGFLTDLNDKYFLGEKSNSLYGCGFGFNVGNMVVDFGIGIDGGGSVNNLAVSGFFIIK